MQTSAPDRDTVRRLAELREQRPVVLSLYLNLDPAEFPSPPARATAVRSLLDEAERAVRERGDLEPRDRKALHGSLARARVFFEDELSPDGAHAVALFTSEPSGLFETLKLPRPVPSQARVNRTPLVMPLAALEQRDRWCVALVSRREGRILRGSPDGLRQVATVSDDVPGQHDQGGWSQARYQRSIDNAALDHLRHTADVLFRHFKRRPFAQLLVGGPHEVVADFEGMLHGYLAERLAGRVDVDVENTTPEEVLAAARPCFEEAEERRERQALERLEAPERRASGVADTLAALNERRVETLVLDARFSAAGRECPACGWVGPEDADSCPVDGTPTERVDDVKEPAVELTLKQDAGVLVLRRTEGGLAARGGIAALLRF
jgi:peptide chain release factor subunit 1